MTSFKLGAQIDNSKCFFAEFVLEIDRTSKEDKSGITTASVDSIAQRIHLREDISEIADGYHP